MLWLKLGMAVCTQRSVVHVVSFVVTASELYMDDLVVDRRRERRPKEAGKWTTRGMAQPSGSVWMWGP